MKKLLNKVGLSIKFSLMVLIILVLTAFISIGIAQIAMEMEMFPDNILQNTKFMMAITLIACIIIGTFIATCAGRSTLKAVDQFVKASHQIADGDFAARVEVKGPKEFKIMAENFNHMAKELGGIEVLRSDFINNFSHEFKTPIVSIKGFAEILKYDDLLPEERKEYLDIVIQESSRLASLASNVLEASKIDQQGILTNKQTFNLGEQIRQCVLLLDTKVSQKDLALNLNIYDYDIVGNKEMMSQVWVNLLDNAIKFTDAKGWIHINMKKYESHIRVEISDTGCGMSQEVLPRIFDKFYQTDVSHATCGNGLGLSIVKKVIELHGGTINCQSAVSKGTTFIILLPTVE